MTDTVSMSLNFELNRPGKAATDLAKGQAPTTRLVNKVCDLMKAMT
jgi:hypothetical protein